MPYKYNPFTSTFDISGSSSSGDVTGPTSSTDNAIARFDSTTGKIIQNSGVTISDNNAISHTLTDDEVGYSLTASSSQTENIFEINSNGESGGDIFVINSSGDVSFGSKNPITKLEVLDTATVPSRGFSIRQINSGAQAAIANFYKSRGSESSQSAVQQNDNIGVFFGRGYDGSTYQFSAGFGFVVDGPVSSGTVPISINFATGTSSLSSGLAANTKVIIDSNGKMGIGTTNPLALLDVAGTARVDALRIDQAPTAETPSATHTVTVSLNGVDYKLLCVAA